MHIQKLESPFLMNHAKMNQLYHFNLRETFTWGKLSPLYFLWTAGRPTSLLGLRSYTSDYEPLEGVQLPYPCELLSQIP